MQRSPYLQVFLIGAFLLSSCATKGASEPGESAPKEPTAAEFIAVADEICTTSARAIEVNSQRSTSETSKKESFAIDENLNRLASERLDKLSELDPPEELRDQFEEYLDLRATNIEYAQERLTAYQDGDAKTREKLDTKMGQLQEDYLKLGGEIGFLACAYILSPEAEDEVRANLTEYFTHPTPAVCKKLSSKEVLRFFAGDAKKCAANLEPSKHVTIRKVEGVDGVTANALIEPSAYDNTVLTVSLVYEGGTYKIDEYEPKS